MENSDDFVNLVNVTVLNWGQLDSLHCHGLLGQTWRAPTTRGLDVAPVEGFIDDYVIADGDLFGVSSVSTSYRTAMQAATTR
jgi:hypothetical protein